MIIKGLIISGIVSLTFVTTASIVVTSANAQGIKDDSFYAYYDMKNYEMAKSARKKYGINEPHNRDYDYYDNENNNFDWPYGRGVGH